MAIVSKYGEMAKCNVMSERGDEYTQLIRKKHQLPVRRTKL